MRLILRSFIVCCTVAVATLPVLAADVTPALTPKSVYDSARRSLVVVQYVWASELGRREISSAGVVVTADGLVLCPAVAFDDRIAEKQITEVKVILPRPGEEPLELEADYQGRDDRARVAFVRPRLKRDFVPLPISDSAVDVGQPFYSIGLMGRGAGYKPYLVRGTVAATVPGERTQIIIDGSLAGVGSPVLGEDGRMIGFVDSQPALSMKQGQVVGPPPVPNSFTPSADLIESLKHPPTPGKPTIIPWFGVFEMTGLTRDELAYYGLAGPVAQIAVVAVDGPAEKAGLKQGDLIIKINGQLLEAGDSPEQIPALVRRRLLYLTPGDEVTATVVSGKGVTPRDVKVRLAANPARPNQMERFWAEDMAVGVRDMAYLDAYVQHLPPGVTGVIVCALKSDGPAAAAKIRPNDVVLKFNGKSVTGLLDFVKQYKAHSAVSPPEAVVLLIRRDGRDETVRIEPSGENARR